MNLNPFEYKVKIYNGSKLLTILYRYISGNIQHRQNEPSALKLDMIYDDVADYLVAGYRYVIERSSGIYGISAYEEFGGHLVDIDPLEDDFMNRRISLICYGYRELLNRRYILYTSDSARSKKSGLVETVILDFINENLGPGASNSNRRADGSIPNLIVPSSKGRGISVRGEDKSWQKLSDVINDYCKTGDMYLDIYYNNSNYYITISEGLSGVDRSANSFNLDNNNPFRVSPVVFSAGIGNLALVKKKTLNSNIFTSSTAIGSGLDSDRRTHTSHRLSISDIEKRETVVNGVNDDSVGLSLLSARGFENNKIELYDFDIRQVSASVYGRDYFCGDKVTLEYDGSKHMVINAVSLDFSNPSEEVRVEVINV